jgi:uncharacterized protein (TIGR00375 family)
MTFLADFHIHSHYSRATSKDCKPEMLDFWAKIKGIDVQGAGDFTHHAWRQELNEKLTMDEDGLYVLKDEFIDKSSSRERKVRFIISGEISSIYKKNGKTRKVHNLILLPDLAAAHRLSKRLEAIGNLHSDGRPILGLDSKTLLGMTLDVCPQALFIPAHIWTPHFSVLGSKSGFDHIEECFEDLTDNIFALETGLSSDPPMNWRLSCLDRFALVSNSDAHSPGNLAREANIFDTDISYKAIYTALKNNDNKAFKGTIEFFPEEGKYHFDGHRACKIQWEPSQTIAASGKCPVCGGQLTIGVLHRVEELADRAENFKPPHARGFERLVPLAHVIGSSIGTSASSVRATACYQHLVKELGPELFVLRDVAIGDIKAAAGELIAEGVRRMRAGELLISAGYDGEYGVVALFSEQERSGYLGQADLFGTVPQGPRKKKSESRTRQKSPVKKNEKNIQDRKSAHDPEIPFGLNNRQWDAVSANGKAVMVIAGPGTGKTRTLVHRVAFLVKEQGVAPSSITAITFTNKAAAEMRFRLNDLFDKQTARTLTIGTFHGVCLDMLKNESPLNPVSVVDQATARAVLEEALQTAGGGVPLPEAARLISRAKAYGREALTALGPEIKKVYSEYQRRLERLSAVDFDDILLLAFDKLENDPGFARRSGARMRHVLVDEFQDINEIQFSLIRKWGKEADSIFIIGDPHQAIYGFRGASPGYFDTFAREFSEVKRIALSSNYRSPQEVVLSAHSVISCGAQGKYAPEVSGETEPGSGKIRLVETRDEFNEALFITKEIGRMMGGVDMLDTQMFGSRSHKRPAGHRGFSDFAVLYRTHRQAGIIERCFIKEGIQYKVAGRSEILDDKEVRLAVSFFKFIVGPSDLCSLAQCLRGFGAEKFNEILDRYVNGIRELAALKVIGADDSFPLSAREAVIRIAEVAEVFRQKIENKENPAAILSDWMIGRGLGEDHPAFLAVHIAEMHQDMQSFLYAITMGQEADVLRNGSKILSSDAVTLTTLHAAKGLEFPVVFLCGVNEGLIPLKGPINDEIDIDEERRLFYVGLTRTREELMCTMAKQRSFRGAIEPCTPSRFIKDMGEKNLSREKFRPEPEARQMSFL